MGARLCRDFDWFFEWDGNILWDFSRDVIWFDFIPKVRFSCGDGINWGKVKMGKIIQIMKLFQLSVLKDGSREVRNILESRPNIICLWIGWKV